MVDPATYKIVTVLPYSGQSTATTTTTRERSASKFSDRDRETIRKQRRRVLEEPQRRCGPPAAPRAVRSASVTVFRRRRGGGIPSTVYRDAPDCGISLHPPRHPDLRHRAARAARDRGDRLAQEISEACPAGGFSIATNPTAVARRRGGPRAPVALFPAARRDHAARLAGGRGIFVEQHGEPLARAVCDQARRKLLRPCE